MSTRRKVTAATLSPTRHLLSTTTLALAVVGAFTKVLRRVSPGGNYPNESSEYYFLSTEGLRNGSTNTEATHE